MHYPEIAARTPSTMYCTASAARITPSRRESTTLLVAPMKPAMRAVSANTTKHSTNTIAMTAEGLQS